jgi:signal transduction histidine kinase
MRNSELAAWLLEHKAPLVEALASRVPPSTHPTSRKGEREVFGAALFDSVIEVAQTGVVEHLDLAARQAARRSVISEVPLARLLREVAAFKEAVWDQLKQSCSGVSEVLTLAEALEPIILRLVKVITQSYIEANQQAQDALAAEIARLQHDAERRSVDRSADLTKANAELTKLQQAKIDFISIAAHELKTPLTLIYGYTNMLREMAMRGDDTTEAAPLLDGILRGTERLSAIVEDMLDVSVIDTDALSLHIEKVSLATAVSIIAAQNARNLEERKQKIHIGELGRLPYVEIDARRLHQILGHLVNNAIKYTPDGGEIFIDGWRLPDDGAGKGGQFMAGDFVELTVRDTGIGIAPEDRERIFEKFFRVGKSSLHSTGKVKFKGAGPGLGLPIARGLAEAHGGRLWAESPGHDEVNCPGSTFHLLLPIRAKPHPSIAVTWVKPPAGLLDEGEVEPHEPGAEDTDRQQGDEQAGDE